MLTYISQYIVKDEFRLYPIWDRYIHTLTTNMEIQKQRHMSASNYEHPGVMLLKSILSFIDIPYMIKKRDDYLIFNSYLKYIENDLSTIFNPVTTGRTYKDMFVSKKTLPVSEILIPVRDIDPIGSMPFTKLWNDWKDTRPVRFLDHDSDEYTLFTLNDRVSFKSSQPSYALFSINPILLAFKYYKFVTDTTLSSNEDKTPQAFIHKYVLNGFYDDLVDIWLLKQATNALRINSDTLAATIDINKVMSDSRFGYVGQGYKEAMFSLFKEKERLINGNIQPNSFMSARLLKSGSCLDRLNMLADNLDIPVLRQYQYLIYLRDRQLFNFLIGLYSLRPQLPIFKSMLTKLKQQLIRYERARIWDSIRGNNDLRDEIELEIRTIKMQVDAF